MLTNLHSHYTDIAIVEKRPGEEGPLRVDVLSFDRRVVPNVRLQLYIEPSVAFVVRGRDERHIQRLGCS